MTDSVVLKQVSISAALDASRINIELRLTDGTGHAVAMDPESFDRFTKRCLQVLIEVQAAHQLHEAMSDETAPATAEESPVLAPVLSVTSMSLTQTAVGLVILEVGSETGELLRLLIPQSMATELRAALAHQMPDAH